mmetsp:Transcript_27702/g.59203  ORF Transcript_27702/g.59203 Transcript_27702/m.59203 type:complete len:204 (-) Transcript_27702:306-917(-)
MSSSLPAEVTAEDGGQVETLVLNEPILPIVPFGLALPSSLTSIRENGVVGSIVMMGKKSAMVWVSWGPLDTSEEAKTSPETYSSFGSGSPTMGQLVVAMPRTQYKGAFPIGSKEASCSQLVGSSSSEDQMLANQMASRLSSRSGMAIYVSCQLSSAIANNGGSAGGAGPGLNQISSGMDLEMLSHRAAALAEKEIWRILQQHR